MQLSTVTAAAIIGFASTAVAQTASVVNNCDFPIYIQYNADGGSAGTPTELAPSAASGVAISSPGAAILVADSPSMNPSLTFEYALNPNGSSINYDLSNAAGNPFDAYENNIVPSDPSCPTFDCGPYTGNSCYSTPEDVRVDIIYQDTCPSYPVDLTATICVQQQTSSDRKRRVVRRF